MDGDDDELQFQTPVSDQDTLYDPVFIGRNENEQEVTMEKSQALSSREFDDPDQKNIKQKFLYEDVTYEDEEDEDSTFGELAEEKIAEKQFILEQAQIQEALNMIANLEIVMFFS